MNRSLKRVPVLLAILLVLTAGPAQVGAFAQAAEQAPATPDQLRQECEMTPANADCLLIGRPRPYAAHALAIRAGGGPTLALGDATVQVRWAYADLFGYVMAIDVRYGQ